MKTVRVQPAAALRGSLEVPGDKSMTHRAVMMGALAEGTTLIRGYLPSEDCLCTVGAFGAMGIHSEVEEGGRALRIYGNGMQGLREPAAPLDLGNSGTSLRLLAGILAAQPFFSVMTGDASLCSRPMGRVVAPLREMGATVLGRSGGQLAPLAVVGGPLRGIRHVLPVASAQVKSALLLAGLYASGETVLTEPAPSRDHTERLFRYFGIPLEREGALLRLGGVEGFSGREICVPGDFSSAAFFMVAATLIEGSDLRIVRVGMNPTRTGLLEVLGEMGGRIDVENRREVAGEPIADLRVRSAHLRGIGIRGSMIPRMIDEFPIFCVAAAAAEGETVVRDARELRVKESDRIAAMAEVLSAAGIKVQELPDGIRIDGGLIDGARCRSLGDHRVAMAMIMAGLAAKGEITVEDIDCIETSFPAFIERLGGIVGAHRLRVEGDAGI